jgi:hypothetical protein
LKFTVEISYTRIYHPAVMTKDRRQRARRVRWTTRTLDRFMVYFDESIADQFIDDAFEIMLNMTIDTLLDRKFPLTDLPPEILWMIIDRTLPDEFKHDARQVTTHCNCIHTSDKNGECEDRWLECYPNRVSCILEHLSALCSRSTKLDSIINAVLKGCKLELYKTAVPIIIDYNSISINYIFRFTHVNYSCDWCPMAKLVLENYSTKLRGYDFTRNFIPWPYGVRATHIHPTKILAEEYRNTQLANNHKCVAEYGLGYSTAAGSHRMKTRIKLYCTYCHFMMFDNVYYTSRHHYVCTVQNHLGGHIRADTLDTLPFRIRLPLQYYKRI